MYHGVYPTHAFGSEMAKAFECIIHAQEADYFRIAKQKQELAMKRHHYSSRPARLCSAPAGVLSCQYMVWLGP
jgi:hypothetical protein